VASRNQARLTAKFFLPSFEGLVAEVISGFLWLATNITAENNIASTAPKRSSINVSNRLIDRFVASASSLLIHNAN
jgi:hypothetical protein